MCHDRAPAFEKATVLRISPAEKNDVLTKDLPAASCYYKHVLSIQFFNSLYLGTTYSLYFINPDKKIT